MDLKCFPLPAYLQTGVHVSILWVCGSTLLLKKWRHEDPKRCWMDFALDTAKQLAGMYWVHAWSSRAIGCTEHLAGAMVEATMGVLVEFVLLTLFSRMFENGAANPRIFRTGEYRTRGGLLVPGAFVVQLLLWLACVTAMLCVLPLVTPPYVAACRLLLRPLEWFPRLELLLVALVGPCVLYAFQAWVTDDFLKKEGDPGMFWEFARKRLPGSLVDFVQETFVNVDPLPLLKPAPPAPPLSDPRELLRNMSGASVRSKVSTLARAISGALGLNNNDDVFEPPAPPAATEEDHGHGVGSLGASEPPAPASEAPPSEAPAPSVDEEALALAARAQAAQEAVAAAASHLEAAEATQTNPHRLKELLRQREEELKELHRQLEKVMATEDAAHKQFSEALTFAECKMADGGNNKEHAEVPAPGA